MAHFTRFSQAAALLLVLIPIMTASTAGAQGHTVGYLDPDPLIPVLPEYPEIQRQLKEHQASNQQELQVRADEFQAQVAEFQSQQADLTAEEQAARATELQQRQNELQAFAQEKERGLGRKQAELMAPVIQKVQSAIDEVAKEKNLDMVLRTSSLLYAKDSTAINITLDVATKLGLEITSEATP